jgi:hypothetical protein
MGANPLVCHFDDRRNLDFLMVLDLSLRFEMTRGEFGI